MKTYDDMTYGDITNVVQVESADALDLREDAAACAANNTPCEFWRADAAGEKVLEILWVPSERRAEIVWVEDFPRAAQHTDVGQWTDAESVGDAIRRFFGVDGAEITN